LAKDLVDGKTDLIVAVNIPGAAALKPITRATPAVFVLAS
jgi:hypothetical protein